MAVQHTLLETIQSLPPERVAEIEDFVAFIASRERQLVATRDWAEMTAPAFAEIWNNPEDDVYDAI